jgi:hypothetical protein
MKEGRDVVRIFDKNSLSWQTLPGVKLSEYRWYPTQVRAAAAAGAATAAGALCCGWCSTQSASQAVCQCGC